MSSSTSDILVLYGSTRGTSKKAAESFAESMPDKLSSVSASLPTIRVVGPTSLDEFLKEPLWTPTVVIFVSSFGRGDAPMRGRKFRAKCDLLQTTFGTSEETKDDGEGESPTSTPSKPLPQPLPLAGVRFALCGLGDSDSYPNSYMGNPKVVVKTLQLLGADLIGIAGEETPTFGKADAGPGNESQQKDIQNWVDGIWEPLAQSLLERKDDDTPSMEQLQKARDFILQESYDEDS